MKTLIGMSDFVLEQKQSESIIENRFINAELITLEKIRNYARFLKQPLTLEMFVPTDKQGNILKGKPLSPAPDSEWIRWENEEYEYFAAKERVLFEGFMISDSHFENSKHTIFLESPKGDFVGHKHNWEENWDLYGITVEGFLYLSDNEIELTESALKQIGL